jgi:hypothetical protein
MVDALRDSSSAHFTYGRAANPRWSPGKQILLVLNFKNYSITPLFRIPFEAGSGLLPGQFLLVASRGPLGGLQRTQQF